MEPKKVKKMKALFQEYNQWYQIEPRLAEYDRFAWSIIGKAGFPTKWEDFIKTYNETPNPPTEVKIANAIFYSVQAVRDTIVAKNAEHVTLIFPVPSFARFLFFRR
jgi:hypothetical protein